MDFVLKVDCDNAAFGNPDVEVSRILREVAGRVEAGYKNGPVVDLNGNSVGQFSFDEVKSKEDH